MASKLIVFLAVSAVIHCSEAGLDHAAIAEPIREDLTSFSYDVADPYTGDFKSQSETRVGGTVQGQYSLLDADGTRRTVDYAADDLNGFNAVVRKDAVGVAAPVVAAKVVAPTAARTVAAPIIAAPNVLTGGALYADRTLATPSLYAASAPLLSRTVLNGGIYGARTVAAPTLLTDAARYYDARTVAAPAVVNTGVLSRTIAAPVVTGGARLVDTRTYGASNAFNTGFLTRGDALYSSPLVTRTLASPGFYAASAPLVTGGYHTGHDLFATRTLASPLVTGGFVGLGGRLVSPLNTYSGRLVTGHDVYALAGRNLSN